MGVKSLKCWQLGGLSWQSSCEGPHGASLSLELPVGLQGPPDGAPSACLTLYTKSPPVPDSKDALGPTPSACPALGADPRPLRESILHTMSGWGHGHPLASPGHSSFFCPQVRWPQICPILPSSGAQGLCSGWGRAGPERQEEDGKRPLRLILGISGYKVDEQAETTGGSLPPPAAFRGAGPSSLRLSPVRPPAGLPGLIPWELWRERAASWGGLMGFRGRP